MTLHELSQLYYLKREIDMDKSRLYELRQSAASPASQDFSGIPKGSQSECALERKSIKIFELEKIIEQKIEQCNETRLQLEKYISEIEDSFTRQIFTHRFVNCLTWRQVANRIGGGNTSDSVRKTCRRYLSQKK